VQFGFASGMHGALRSAIGATDPNTGQWSKAKPTREDYTASDEPHARGAVLVSAVFAAFVTIYRARSADLIRLATNGTGVLPAGEISHDLAGRLAGEAAKVADQVLNMCIRALDYCPPVDVTFGDYLRAIITPIATSFRSTIAGTGSPSFRHFAIAAFSQPTSHISRRTAWSGRRRRFRPIIRRLSAKRSRPSTCNGA
jgi:hypothetical protein